MNWHINHIYSKFMLKSIIITLMLGIPLVVNAQGKITRPHKPNTSVSQNTSDKPTKTPPKVLVSSSDGYINGYGYVDLGLPSGNLWSTCNLGANNPWEYGDYYAWGETSTKAIYSDKNNLYYYKDLADISGNPKYDASTLIMGSGWQMPNKDDFQELLDNCSWFWDYEGFRIVGPNGNSIYLPRANTTYKFEGQFPTCIYFSSSPSQEVWDNKRTTFRLYKDNSHSEIRPYTRGEGCPIRPVAKVVGKSVAK